jgi:hypothetical protein
LAEGKLRLIDGRELGDDNQLLGVGMFVKHNTEDAGYGYPKDDAVLLGDYRYERNEWEEIEVRASQVNDQADWEPLGRACARKWRQEVESGNRGA